MDEDHSDYSQNEAQQRYEHSEKGRKRKREYMKRYRENPEIQQREQKRDRKAYYREYRQRKRAEQKSLEP